MAKNADYYKLLEVSRDASAEQIRKAYRRLARELHPDVNKSADASERFAEVQEAYDVLSDAEKRKAYDRFGRTGVGAGASGAGAGGDWGGGFSGGGSVNFDPDEVSSVFEELFRGRGQSPRSPFGSDDPFSRATHTQPRPQRGQDSHQRLDITFMTAVRGGTESVRRQSPAGIETIEVRIPKGIHSGARLRVKSKGNPGREGGQAGDLIFAISVGGHPWFRREGLDLLLDVPITIAEAALGTDLTVPLLEGSMTVKTPPGVAGGKKLRVKGKGITDAKGNTGDFYVVLQIVAPDELSQEDRETLQSMSQRLKNPRKSAPWANE